MKNFFFINKIRNNNNFFFVIFVKSFFMLCDTVIKISQKNTPNFTTGLKIKYLYKNSIENCKYLRSCIVRIILVFPFKKKKVGDKIDQK